MALNPQEKGKSQIGIPAAGTIPARCARIVELGQHDHSKYGVKDQVQIWYSLPTRLITDEGDYQGKQHMIRTQRMTKSSNEKAALMKHVTVLNPQATSLTDLLNQPCYITVVHNEVKDSTGKVNTYANLMGLMSVPEGMAVGNLDTDPFYFDFDNPDAEVWTKHLWDNVKEYIQEAVNYKGSAVERMVLGLEANGK
jgi:hypothetical protein